MMNSVSVAAGAHVHNVRQGEDACELIHYGTALAQSGKTVYQLKGYGKCMLRTIITANLRLLPF